MSFNSSGGIATVPSTLSIRIPRHTASVIGGTNFFSLMVIPSCVMTLSNVSYERFAMLGVPYPPKIIYIVYDTYVLCPIYPSFCTPAFTDSPLGQLKFKIARLEFGLCLVIKGE